MHLDWECPICFEKHISMIKKINVGDKLSLKCVVCNNNINFEVKQKRYILSYLHTDLRKSHKDAVAWE